MLTQVLLFGRALLTFVAAQSDTARSSPADFTIQLEIQLEARSHLAANLFRDANRARDRLDLQTAELLYRGVLTHTPDLDHVHRRLCGVVMQLGRRADAVNACQTALGLSDSPENRVALAAVLMTVTEDNQPSAADYENAARLLARDHRGRLVGATGIIDDCRVGIEAGALSTIRACIEQLDAITVCEEAAHYFAWLWGALSADWLSTSLNMHYAGRIGD